MPLPFNFDVNKYPSLPKLHGLFVTGTDTGVGKTLVAGAIARRLRQLGRRVEVFKPVATGCPRKAGLGLVSEDAEFLAACAESRRTLAEIAPVCYATAVAPNVAAMRERRPVDLQTIFDAYSSLANSLSGGSSFRGEPQASPSFIDAVIVEGVGGLLCPITDDFWVIHFAKMTALPLVIVARPGLGTINHTLLTLHAARTAGLNVAGVVVNDYLLEPPYDLPLPTTSPRRQGKSSRPSEPPFRDDTDIAMFHNPQEIAARGKVNVLAVVPHEQQNSVQQATIGPDTEFNIAQVLWVRMMEQGDVPPRDPGWASAQPSKPTRKS
jgi:dethiobiotin synthetase